jgi:hypothetical protein
MSKLLTPNVPGGLLSPATFPGGLSTTEESMVENLQQGNYQNETPGGTVNGSNTAFTLSVAPSPSASLKLFVNGQLMAAGGEDYTLSSLNITMVTAPPSGSILRAWYLSDA